MYWSTWVARTVIQFHAIPFRAFNNCFFNCFCTQLLIPECQPSAVVVPLGTRFMGTIHFHESISPRNCSFCGCDFHPVPSRISESRVFVFNVVHLKHFLISRVYINLQFATNDFQKSDAVHSTMTKQGKVQYISCRLNANLNDTWNDVRYPSTCFLTTQDNMFDLNLIPGIAVAPPLRWLHCGTLLLQHAVRLLPPQWLPYFLGQRHGDWGVASPHPKGKVKHRMLKPKDCPSNFDKDVFIWTKGGVISLWFHPTGQGLFTRIGTSARSGPLKDTLISSIWGALQWFISWQIWSWLVNLPPPNAPPRNKGLSNKGFIQGIPWLI